jgi:hypothetical protein
VSEVKRETLKGVLIEILQMLQTELPTEERHTYFIESTKNNPLSSNFVAEMS